IAQRLPYTVSVCHYLGMNHKPVTPGARATAHLDAVKAARAELDALYATEHADGRKVAALHDVMRLGIQIAKVEAALEQAAATWAVVDATENMKELQNQLAAKVAECE